MDCPKCGLETQANQKYCRSCGASLQLTTQPLTRQGAISDFESQAGISRHEEKHTGSNLVVWGFMLMFIGVAIGVIGKMLLHQDLVKVIGVLISLAGMFLSAYPYLSPSVPGKKEPTRPSHAEVPTPPQSMKYLSEERTIDYVPSITERTTTLLQHSTVTPPGEKDDGEAHT